MKHASSNGRLRPRFKFVPVSRKHLKRLNEIINDPEVARYTTITPPCSMRSTVLWSRHLKISGHFWWAIICDGDIVGSVDLRRRARRGDPKLGHCIAVGLALDRCWWGKGIGRRALAFAKRVAKAKGFKRLEIDVVKENERALKLYRRFGFKVEGVRGKTFKLGKRYCDDMILAMWLA